jgi:hypothetical protein
MKFCYCDESGTGGDPVAVMVGVIVDSHRMHLTKSDWKDLLTHLSTELGRDVRELHTAEFYPGNGIWRGIDGEMRARLISTIFEWLRERKHRIVYAAVRRSRYEEMVAAGTIPTEVGSLWRFLGLHLILAVQKTHSKLPKKKGHTVFVFDHKKRDEARFIDLVTAPPPWTDTYYKRRASAGALDCVVDVPYFGDSTEVALVQLADFLAFFLRRYIEIKEGLVPARYEGEDAKLDEWGRTLSNLSVGASVMYPRSRRCACAELFFSAAPRAVVEL